MMGGRSSSFKSKGGSMGSYVKAHNKARESALDAFDKGKDIDKKFGEIHVKRVSRNRILIKGRGPTQTIIPDTHLSTWNMKQNNHFGKGVIVDGYLSEADVKARMPSGMYKK